MFFSSESQPDIELKIRESRGHDDIPLLTVSLCSSDGLVTLGMSLNMVPAEVLDLHYKLGEWLGGAAVQNWLNRYKASPEPIPPCPLKDEV